MNDRMVGRRRTASGRHAKPSMATRCCCDNPQAAHNVERHISAMTYQCVARLKTIRAVLTSTSLTIALAQAAAQGLPDLAELRKVTDAAMVKVGGGDIEGGIKEIRPLTVIPTAEFDTLLGQLPLQLPGISARFGSSIGFEFVREDRIGDSMARIVYVNKLEKHAMRWMFYCYKGKGGWVINTFRFDDKWHELF